ncbi:MAG: CoA ester lyase [Deltaproteobacteria bacterium]|nr:CoA ester lyase [Deltaproteobacteria bacterium]
MKPRRTVLSVPGHVEKMHDKALNSGSDAIMLDLEDSVPVDIKVDARGRIIQSLLSRDWSRKTVLYRMNGLDTPFGYRDLLEVMEAAGPVIDAVVVPKINHPGDIHFVSRMLDGIELNKGWTRRIGIEASIETAVGLEVVSEIARASDRIQTLVFGVADYSASIGARLVSLSGHGEKEAGIYPGHRWHFAMSRMVMAAKANGLQAIDAPYGNFKDSEGLKQGAAMACALGYDGKWAIHPDQVDIINQMFSPSTEDIERARKVLDAHHQATIKGLGAVAVEGRMVDQATVRLAKQLWEQAGYLGLI